MTPTWMPLVASSLEALKESAEGALRSIVANITAVWLRQHKNDGSHGDLTADSIDIADDTTSGSFAGNVSGSLVPTADGQDLGAAITESNASVSDRTWRHLRLSGSITFTPFTTSTPAVTGRPVLSRSSNNLSLASQGTFEFALVNGINTHTFTIGRGLSGLTTNRAVSCAGLSSSASVQADHLIVTDGITAPSATGGLAKIYVDTADGDLKVVFGDGTVKTIVTDT